MRARVRVCACARVYVCVAIFFTLSRFLPSWSKIKELYLSLSYRDTFYLASLLRGKTVVPIVTSSHHALRLAQLISHVNNTQMPIRTVLLSNERYLQENRPYALRIVRL